MEYGGSRWPNHQPRKAVKLSGFRLPRLGRLRQRKLRLRRTRLAIGAHATVSVAMAPGTGRKQPHSTIQPIGERGTVEREQLELHIASRVARLRESAA